MRSLRFKKIKLENFRSWEHLELPLEGNGAALIVGKNGSGKTSIFSALVWALFGRNLQGISPGNLVRRKAFRCRVTVELQSPEEKEVTLYRERKHGRERVVIKDGSGERLFTKQEFTAVSSRYLGINWKSFCNVVFIGNGVNRFFLMLTDGEKKSLLEELLHTDRFQESQSVAARRIRYLEGKEQQIKGKISVIKSSLERLQQELEQAKSVGISRLEEEILRIHEKIQKLNTSLGNTEQLETWESEFYSCSQDAEKHEELLASLVFQFSSIESQIYRIRSMGGGVCPECRRGLSVHESKVLVKEKRSQLETIDKSIVSAKDKVSDLREKLKEISSRIENIARIASKRENLLHEMESLRKEREHLSLGCQRVVRNQQKYYSRALEKYKNNLGRIAKVLPYFDFWVEGFGPKGIRADFLRGFLPWLEERSNTYLAYFSDPFRLGFSLKRGSFETRITSKRLGMMQYPELSAGERRRLDLAVSLALRDITEDARGMTTNLQVLDEVIEGLDADGAEQFSEMLRIASVGRMTFLISHNDQLAGGFDRCFEAEKKNGNSILSHRR